MSDAKAPTSGELNRQLQGMEEDLRAYVDAQLDGVTAGARGARRSYRAAVPSSPLSRGWAWLLVFLLFALFAMVAWLGWGISVLSGQVEELATRVESLTLEVERQHGTKPEADARPEGVEEEPDAASGDTSTEPDAETTSP